MTKVRGVYEHPKGSRIWWCQYFVHGKRHRERAGNRSDAIKLYSKRKTEALQGDKFPELRRRRVTFGELIDDAIAFARVHNKSPQDIVGKGELVRPRLGALQAEAVTPDAISAWISQRKCSPATFNHYKAFFSLCFREGMRSGKVTSNPARLVRRRAEPAGRQRYLTREEYVLVMAQIDRPERKLAFLVSIYTGMRLSEQFTLLWSQIDFARGEIHLTETKNGSDRSIPMVSLVRGALAGERERVSPAPSDLVFPRQRNGKRPTHPRWFPIAAAAAGVENYTWHNNRHTFISWLAINGTPLKTIQELAGHKSISMTARYAHLSPDHRIAEMERMASPVAPTAIKTAIGKKIGRA
jgi:integrase